MKWRGEGEYGFWDGMRGEMDKQQLKERRADSFAYSDVLHPNRANVSKEDLRGKLAELYKCTKEQVNVFGLQTQFGGGKTTGFALVYDSPEALKKFEPHFRLVRVGVAQKIEKPSRQQRTSNPEEPQGATYTQQQNIHTDFRHRQAAQEPPEDPPRNGQGQRPKEEEEPGLNLARFLRSLLGLGCDGYRSVLEYGNRICASQWSRYVVVAETRTRIRT